MVRLVKNLRNSNLFKTFVKAKHSALAIKDDSQIFVAFTNVIRAIDIHEPNSLHIMNADSAGYIVDMLILNRNSSLLASVGSHDISIFDVKSTKQPKESCLLATLPATKAPILSVMWHPASKLNSDLVILTHDEILVYDIVVSKAVPSLKLKFSEYPQLAESGVSSISFGSSVHFAGMITLYITTKSGEIYSIYPFISPGSTVFATKAAASRYVSEWDATMETVDELLPASEDFHKFRTPFQVPAKVVGSVRQQLESPLRSEALESEHFSWSIPAEGLNYKLTGPVATVGLNPKILELASNDKFPSVMVAYEDGKDKIAFKLFAQVHSIIPSFKAFGNLPAAPVKPERPPVEPENIVYKKIAKGFGYEEVVQTPSQDSEAEYRKQEKAYKAKLLAHRIEAAYVHYSCDSFNKLTPLTNDSVQFACDRHTVESLKLVEKTTFVLSNSDQVLIGDASEVSRKLDCNTNLGIEIDYKVKKLNPEFDISSKDFAYIDDVIEGTGGYIVALSPSGGVSTIQMRPETKTPPIKPLVIMPKPDSPQDNASDLKLADSFLPEENALTAKDLRLIYDKINEFKHPENIDFSGDFAKPSYNMSSEFLKKVSKSTQFLVTMQIKLGLQISQVKSQIQFLNDVSTPASGADKILEERTSKLLRRQTALLNRIEDVHNRISEKFETCKSKMSLPLSDEERSWFHEINSLIKKVTVGTENSPSLESVVESLKEKVTKVANDGQTSDENEAIEESLSKLRLGVSLYNINKTLDSEKVRIDAIKGAIEGMMIRVHDAGLSA